MPTNKHRTRHPKNTRKHQEPQTNHLSIHDRPKFIHDRKRIGNWEIDTVMGKTGHSVLLTVVDRLSRFTLIRKIDRKEATDVKRGLVDLLGSVPKEFVHSLTPSSEV